MSKNMITTIIIIVVLIVVLALLWYFGKKKQVKAIIRALVLEAENNYGTGTGDIKYEVVVGQIYKCLPPLVQLFITPKLIDMLIEEAVEYIKQETYEDGSTIETVLTPRYIESDVSESSSNDMATEDTSE